MRNKQFAKDNSGMALLTATVFISIALIVVASISARYLQQRRLADAYQNYEVAFDGLEAAVAQCKAEFETNGFGSGNFGMPSGWKSESPILTQNSAKEFIIPTVKDSTVTPQQLPVTGNSSGSSLNPPILWVGTTVAWGIDKLDSNGDGLVDNDLERFMYSIHASAQYRGVMRRAEVVYRGGDVNCWRNAIFAGDGAVGALINGNVTVSGSVHLLGTNLAAGGAALAAMTMSGTSLINNNYSGLPANLFARIPNPEQVDMGGTMTNTLRSKVRVKRGLVSMSGNSHIGESASAGALDKKFVDGIYNADGWTGNSVDPTADGRGIPKNAYSDNGTNADYDCGNRISFPKLTDDWRNPTDGAKVIKNGTTYFTHEEYFSQVLVGDVGPRTSLGNPTAPVNTDTSHTLKQNVVLDTKNRFYWNATTKELKIGAAAPATDPNLPNNDYIWYNPANSTLKVNGQIMIQGNFSTPSKTTINYSGVACMLVTGAVTIESDLLACENLVAGTYNKNTFPRNNCLGIMAKGDITVGTSSQRNVMGAIYSAQTILSDKQTNMVGTYVANAFNMGNQVPSIFQCPVLADNLPLGIVGNYPVLVLSTVSWRELGLS